MFKSLLTLCLLSCALQNFAQFAPLTQFKPFSESVFNHSSNYGDINNDGIVELVNIYGYQLEVMNLLPNGTFEIQYFTHNLQNSQQQVQFFDLDSDGDIDVSNGIGWLENIDNTSFSEASHIYGLGQYDSNYITEDLNGDGSFDLINSNGIYFNNGLGQFTNPFTFQLDGQTAMFVTSPSLADLDNDGDYDLCFLNGYDSKLWTNNGNGEFTLHSTLDGHYRIGDLNGDGFADYIGQTYQNVHIQLNDQQGGYNEQIIAVESQVDFLGSQMWFRNRSPFFDIDSDGDIDLLADQSGRAIQVIRNQNNSTFEYIGDVASGNRYSGPGTCLFNDVNGDELSDITYCFQNVYILTQNLDGTFSPYAINSEGIHDEQASISGVDLDNDGDEDAISSVPGGMVIYENINRNHLANARYLASHPAETLVDVYDYSGDGRLDLITYDTPSSNYKSLSYFEQLEDGNFKSAEEILPSSFISAPCLFDVDQDGTKDIVYFSVPEYPTVSNHLVLCWNEFNSETGLSSTQELGSWTVPVSYYTDKKIIIPGDFNGDGIDDLMTCARNGMLIFEGDGSGNYSVVQIPGYTNSCFIPPGDAVDFDGDAVVDIPFSTGLNYLGYISFNGTEYLLNPIATTANIFATMILHSDLDADGDEDFLYSNYSTVILLFNDGNGNFNNAQTTLGLSNPQFNSLSLIKIDEDELPDLFVGLMSENPNYPYALYSTSNNVNDAYRVICHVFIDENGNGIKDQEELGMLHKPISINGSGNYNYTDGDGKAVIYTTAQSHTVTLNQSPTFAWTATTPWEYTIELNESIPVVDLYFGYQPNGEVNELTADLTSARTRCNSPGHHYLAAVNEGNTRISVIMQYTLNEEYQFIASVPSPSSINGNVYTWEFELLYGETFNVEVDVIMPDWTFMGQQLVSTLEVTSYDLNGTEIANDVDILTESISCSYDPNDKAVDRGFTEAGYVFNNQELEYTIRFENKGNLSAENIWIEDDLSDKLDWNTFQLIGWSHPVTLHMSESGRATFAFENINLPDSASDPLNCNGYVRYRIHMKNDLISGDEITNNANIIFDYNPAIVTNTTLNTIYDCSDLEQSVLLLSELCPGENITAYNQANWIEHIDWYYNDVLIDSTTNLTYAAQTSGTLRMEASNSLCGTQQTWNVTVFTTNPDFTQSTNTLTSNDANSYQWYLNNEPIFGAVSQTYIISESGNYHVEITNEFGCSETSDQQYIIYTEVENLKKSHINFGPNPADQYVNFVVSDMVIETIEIIDMFGKIVFSERMNRTEKVELNVRGLAVGLYSIRLNDEKIGILEIVR